MAQVVSLTTPTTIAPWQDRAQAKVKSTMSKIPPEWRLSKEQLDTAKTTRKLTGTFFQSFLNPRELEITKYPSVILVERIRTKRFCALEVASAYSKAAAVAHQINNCLHEIMFDQALARARELDEYQHEHNKTIGPLHGLPVSLKDQFHVKGTDTTMGYIGWIDTYEGSKDPEKVHLVESQIVKELLSLGAVLYCKTSLPQTLLVREYLSCGERRIVSPMCVGSLCLKLFGQFGETVNNLIGRTLNPVNQNLSCGGSSGGEGALLALGGSSVGIGTDIGGSVRIPAAFCGVYSVKPTHNRFSYRDAANTNPGQNTYPSSVGFLSTSLDGLQLIMSSVLSTKPWLRDPEVASIPWRQQAVDEVLHRTSAENGSVKSGERPLKLGIYWTNGEVEPQPPIKRGLRMVVEAVQMAGHKIVDWNPPSQTTAKRVHLAFLLADGAHDVHTQLALSGEPLIPSLEKTFKLRDPINLLEYQKLTLEGRDYSAAYSDYWNSTDCDDGQIVDAVIMPVAPHAAVIPGKYYHTAYTEAINLMSYSAAVIPVTLADKTLDPYDKSYQPRGEVDKLNWEAYDPEIYHGAPVGVQIVAKKYEEEKVLAIAKVINAALLASQKEMELS
ncbi:amidase signature domain-containing protein [Tirmania nivea]|nr:amidase signature domain-containing protein [Tirmania nivea]